MKNTLLLMIFVIFGLSAVMSQSITTTYAGGNGHDGNMLDFYVSGTSDVTIDSLDFNISAVAGTDAYILVYYKVGTYVGAETTASQWTRHDSVHVISAGTGLPTRVKIGGLVIPQGQTYGLYLTTHSTGPDVAYTNGANTYSDANVTITTGCGLGYPFNSPNTPRTWNGTVYYSVNSCTTPGLMADMAQYCAGDMVTLTASGSSGFYNWYTDSTVDTMINSLSEYVFTSTSDVIYYVEALCPYEDTVMMDVGSQVTTYSSDARGFWFTSPSDFVITGLRVPTEITGDQTIEVIRFTNGAPPSFSSTTNDFVSLGYWQGVAGTDVIPVNIIVHTGDIIGIVGVRGSTTSYGSSSPYTTSIGGISLDLYRLGMQYNIATQQLHDVWTESGNSVGRVEMYYRTGYVSTPANIDVQVGSLDYINTNVSICQGDSILLEGDYQKVDGTYYDTLLNITGCDSIIETALTVNSLYLDQNTMTICSNDSVFAEGAWQNTTGVYYDTLASIAGCDSIIELDLTVNPVFLDQNTMTICTNDSIFAEGLWQNTTGIYYDTLASVAGCDSIIELDLTVNSVFLDQNTMTICGNDSIFAEGLWQNTTGIYYDTLASVAGCDSIIELDLVVNPADFNTVMVDICEGDSLFAESAWQITTGMYYDTLMNMYSCDSVMETDLTVHLNPVIDLGMDTAICDGQSITLDPGAYTSYLWSEGTATQTLLVDTNDFSVGANEISVIVTDLNGCSANDTIVVTIDNCTGMYENGFSAVIQVYPNPVSGILNIEIQSSDSEIEMSILSIDGKVISNQQVVDNKTTFNFSEMPKGVYLIKFVSEKGTAVHKIIHE